MQNPHKHYIIILVTLKRAMIVQWKKHEKTCNCKPTYMQPIDKTYHLRGECSLWQVNYGRFWLDNSSETPRRFFNAKNAQDLFTDPS